MEFEVEIKEIRSRIIKIEAKTAYEAEQKVKNDYKHELYILDDSDYAHTEISAVS